MSAIPAHTTPGAPLLEDADLAAMAAELHHDWSVVESSPRRLKRTLTLQDFPSCLDRLVAIGALAESHDHHPDLAIHDYRKLTIELSTHDAGGLTANDFVVARGVDALDRAG